MYSFSDYPPINGSLVTGPDGWQVIGHPCEIVAWLEEFTLLLPSPTQCRAAGLTARDAIETAKIGERASPPSDEYFDDMLEDGSRSIELEHGAYIWLAAWPDRIDVSFGPEESYAMNVTDPAVLTRAANMLSSLQAWLAGWNKEATHDHRD